MSHDSLRVDPEIDAARQDGRRFRVTDPSLIRVPDGRTPRRGVVERLKESIARVGVINPLTITHDSTLVAGLNRLVACRELSMCVPVIFLGPGEDVREIEFDENLARTHLTPEELAEYRAYEARVLAERRAAGMSLRAAAADVGIPESTARLRERPGAQACAPGQEQVRTTGRDGKAYPARPVAAAARASRRERARALKAEGKSLREIARDLGVARGTVAKDLAEHDGGAEPETDPVLAALPAGLAELRATWVAASPEARARFLEEITPVPTGASS